jgi:hypothetical protein
MSDTRLQKFDKAVQLREDSTDVLTEIWKDYSLYSTLEYWIMATILVVPLLFLLVKIDKSKIFLICFYGYTFHVVLAYGDIYGMNAGYWHYPFQLIPSLPSLSIDASIFPVTFMLIYQWTLNSNKKYYLYSIIACGGYAFVFKPLLVALGLFRLYDWVNYLYLFIGYFLISIVAKCFTDVFLWMQKKYSHSH